MGNSGSAANSDNEEEETTKVSYFFAPPPSLIFVIGFKYEAFQFYNNMNTSMMNKVII